MQINKYNDEEKQIIKDIHMKNRCWVIFTMCSLSLYNWYNYSMFEKPIINNISKPYYWNCLIFIFYLVWDMYKMTLSEHRKILYRTDLMIHHGFSLTLYYSGINITSINGSNLLIMECISLTNYLWRKPKYFFWLNYYRLFCIFLVRLPLLFMYRYYFLPYYQETSYIDDFYIDLIMYANLFFIVYDLYLIKQIIGLLTPTKSSNIKNV
jgi:hypothetical protein